MHTSVFRAREHLLNGLTADLAGLAPSFVIRKNCPDDVSKCSAVSESNANEFGAVFIVHCDLLRAGFDSRTMTEAGVASSRSGGGGV